MVKFRRGGCGRQTGRGQRRTDVGWAHGAEGGLQFGEEEVKDLSLSLSLFLLTRRHMNVYALLSLKKKL